MKGAPGFVLTGVLVVGVLYVLHLGLRPDPGRRNLEIFTEMVYSKAFESFSDSPSLPGGTTQQTFVAGVVPRGLLPFRFEAGEEEAKRAGRELVNPLAADDPATLARGAEVFSVYCIACHDAGGNGRGAVVERGMSIPPSLHAARAMEMADGEMFHILALGQNNMASYASQLTREERWSVIRYVRKLQKEGQQ